MLRTIRLPLQKREYACDDLKTTKNPATPVTALNESSRKSLSLRIVSSRTVLNARSKTFKDTVMQQLAMATAKALPKILAEPLHRRQVVNRL
mmetsp:Transcript_12118/g.33327  ORF Transcript_12118/g.33327 Transcript_12118/m.33327 type:complete len:92 (-) Transcript_12118:24-299(-)